MLGNLVLLWLAAFPLMGSPGPATLSLASLGAAFGFRASLPYLAGIIVGTTAVLGIIAAGVTTALAAQPVLLIGLQVAAGLYILYLAWKIATAPVGPLTVQDDQEDGGVVTSFLPGLGLAIANPKAFAAIGAVYSGHMVVAGNYTLDAAIKLAALTAVIVIVNTTWLGFGATFARFLTHPVAGRAVNVAFAVMLVVSVGLALLPA